MVEINVTGQPPSGGRGNRGTFSGTVSDNPQRSAAFEQYQKEQARLNASRPTAAADFARAEAQRARQDRADQTAWTRHRASEDRYYARLDRLQQAELRLNESRLTAEQKLQHRFRLLQHRAQSPLTPSSWNAWQRAHQTLVFQAQQHQQKFGTAPFSAESMRNLRTSVGDEAAAFGVGRTLRLGNVGQRAGYERSWTELERIRHELRRIEKTTQRQLDAETNPSRRASLQRQVDALYTAKRRIEEGVAGHSRATRTVGRGVGLLGAALTNPLVSGGLALGMAAVESGYVINETYAAILNQGRRYRDFRSQLSRMGAAGGFTDGAAMDQMLRRGVLSHYAPGDALTERMRAWGLSPTDVIKYAGAYGVAFHSSNAPVDFAQRARMFSLLPGMNLSEQQLAAAAGQAQTVFGMRPDQYWRKLGEVESAASAKGMDNSRVASAFQSLIQASAARGPTSVSAMSDYYARMITGGGPMMRAGGAESYANNVSSTLGNLVFGNRRPVTTMAIASFVKRHGGFPRSAEQFQKMFRITPDQWAEMMKGGGSRIFSSYLASINSGNRIMAEQYLGNLLQSANPETLTYALKNSGIPLFNSPSYGLYARSVAAGAPVNQQAAAEAGFASSPPPAPSVPRREAMDAVLRWAHVFGIPADRALGLVRKESGFQSGAINQGHYGLAQVGAGALADFNRANGTSFTRADLLNPDIGARVGLWYFKQQHNPGGSWASAYQRYHYGPRSTGNFRDDMQYRQNVARYSNFSDYLDLQNRNAMADAAQLKASQFADKSYQAIVDRLGDPVGTAHAAIRLLGEGADAAGHALKSVAAAGLAAAGTLAKLSGGASLGAMGMQPFQIPSPSDRSGAVSK